MPRAVGQFPLAAHVAGNAEQEVQHNQLVGTAVVEPLIHGSSFPDGVEVQADGCRGRDNRTGDDVIAAKQRALNGLADAVDVNSGGADEGDDEGDGCSQQAGNHQHAEPTYVDTVVGAGYPLAELLPYAAALAALY